MRIETLEELQKDRPPVQPGVLIVTVYGGWNTRLTSFSCTPLMEIPDRS